MNPTLKLQCLIQSKLLYNNLKLLPTEDFVANTTSIANDVDVIFEPIAQPEIYSSPEATTSFSRPVRIRRQPSRLAYFQPGSSLDCQQNMVHANLCNVPLTPHLTYLNHRSVYNSIMLIHLLHYGTSNLYCIVIQHQ